MCFSQADGDWLTVPFPELTKCAAPLALMNRTWDSLTQIEVCTGNTV